MPDPISWGFSFPYYVGAIAIGYLLGSIPSGLMLGKLFGFGDIREIGSGNIGTTNALRTGSKVLALGTLLGDGGKAALAVWLGSLWGPQTAFLAAAAVLLGHLYPVWLGFKGGKGIAVYIGALAVLYYPVGLIFLGVWLGTALLTRYSSLAALLAALAVPPAAVYFEEYMLRDLSLFFLVMVLWSHRENIKRLIGGQESKIGQKSNG